MHAAHAAQAEPALRTQPTTTYEPPATTGCENMHGRSTMCRCLLRKAREAGTVECHKENALRSSAQDALLAAAAEHGTREAGDRVDAQQREAQHTFGGSEQLRQSGIECDEVLPWR